MKAKEILEQFNKYLNDVEVKDGEVTLTEEYDRCYHVRLDLMVDHLNNFAVEEMVEKELNKIDGMEVLYIEAERREDDEEKMLESLNEDMTNAQCMEALKDIAEEAKAAIEKVIERAQYRLIDNVSYTGDEASRVAQRAFNRLNDIAKQARAIYNIFG